jgi:hypothetical protein
MHQVILKPPPGVAVNQYPDGTLRFHYTAETVLPLKAALFKMARELIDQAIAEVEARKAAELARQQLPITRIETIDTELAVLQAQKAEAEKQIAALQ